MTPPSAFICVYLRFTICKYLKTYGQVLIDKSGGIRFGFANPVKPERGSILLKHGLPTTHC